MKTELEKRRLYEKAFKLLERANKILDKVHAGCLEKEQSRFQKAA